MGCADTTGKSTAVRVLNSILRYFHSNNYCSVMQNTIEALPMSIAFFLQTAASSLSEQLRQ
jgi:hypothetical protein